MNITSIRRNAILTMALIFTFTVGGVGPLFGQDLVPVSDIGGGSSIFVFRSKSGASSRRFTTNVRSNRSKSQRLETAKKIKKQYDILGQTEARRARSAVVTPDKVPLSIKTMPTAKAAEIFAGVGEYYTDKNDIDNSVNFFREAVTLDPKNVKARKGYSEALSSKANEYLVNEDTSKAKSFFLESLKYDSNNAAAYFGLGEVYTDLDQTNDAIASYENALKSDAKLSEIYFPLGILYYQKGEIAKADELLTKSAANSDENAETDVLIGVIRISQNRSEEAMKAFQRAKALDPNNAEAYYYNGAALYQIGRPADSLAEFQKAISLKPNYFEAYRGLGQAYFDLKRYPEAVTAYKAATRLKNDDADVYADLGDANREAGNFFDAESAYATTKDLKMRAKEVDKIEIANLWGEIGYTIGRQCEVNMKQAIACRWPMAIIAFQKSVEFRGDAVDYANLAWAYYNAARVDINSHQPDAARPKLEAAKAALEKALTGNAKITDGVLQNLGGVQIDLGDYRGAVESLKPVVEHQPTWTFSKYALGTAYFKLNQFDDAAKMFNAALGDDPNNVNYLTSLGYTQIRLRNAKEIKKVVDRLRKIDPTAASNIESQAKFAGIK